MRGLSKVAGWVRRLGLNGWIDSRRLGPENVPGYWEEHLEKIADRQGPKTPIDEVEFIVLDTETTGLDHRHDRVVSFGGIALSGQSIRIKDCVDWKVRGDLPSSSGSIEVHGLLNTDLESGMSEDLFVERLVRYVGHKVLVGYRPGFDMSILNRMVRQYTGGRLDNLTLDVFDLGMRIDYPVKPQFVNPEPYRLDAQCRRYDIENSGRHTAIGDAFATALLLLRQLEELKGLGLKTLADLGRRYP